VLQTSHSERRRIRRDAIRDSFLPGLEDLPGSQFKFVIGKPVGAQQKAEFAAEEAEYPGTFLQLNATVRAFLFFSSSFPRSAIFDGAWDVWILE
jgi:hypothetical protein